MWFAPTAMTVFISHAASLLCSLYLLFAEAPLPIPSAGRKKKKKDKHVAPMQSFSPSNIHHPSYRHDRHNWFSHYITTGRWFMSCWSHSPYSWYAVHPWPSWIAASPADLGVGKHTHTGTQCAEQALLPTIRQGPKNNTRGYVWILL